MQRWQQSVSTHSLCFEFHCHTRQTRERKKEFRFYKSGFFRRKSQIRSKFSKKFLNNGKKKKFRSQPRKRKQPARKMAESQESHRLLTLDNTADPEAPEEESEVKKIWWENLKGIVAASLSVIMLILGVTSVQLLERRVPDLELQVFRCVAIVGFCLMWMLFFSSSLKVPMSETGATLLYSVVITLDSTTIYMAYSLIPVTAAQCSISGGSILFGLLIFWLCRQETFGPVKILLSLVCLGGVVLVIQPWHRYMHSATDRDISEIQNFNMTTNCQTLDGTLKELTAAQPQINFSDQCKSEMEEYLFIAQNFSDKNIPAVKNKTNLCRSLSTCFLEVMDNDGNLQTNRGGTATGEFLLFTLKRKWMDILGFTIAAVAGLVYTLLFLVLKRHPCLSEQRVRSLFWAFFVVLVLSTILTYLVEKPVWVQSPYDIAAVSVHCITSVATWFLWIYAIQHTSGTVVIIILSTCTVWFLIPQYTILSSILPGHRNWMEVVGVFMVLIGSISGSLKEMLHPTQIHGENENNWKQLTVTRERRTVGGCLYFLVQTFPLLCGTQ